jgi:hypothetical protein
MSLSANHIQADDARRLSRTRDQMADACLPLIGEARRSRGAR